MNQELIEVISPINLEIIEATYEILKDFINNIVPYIEKMIKEVAEYILYLLEQITKEIEQIVKTYKFIELNIPNSSIPINNYDYIPQGPPIKEKSIRETAIENFHDNMNKFKSSKLFITIKQKCPAFVETLIFEILILIIFKALGMQ